MKNKSLVVFALAFAVILSVPAIASHEFTLPLGFDDTAELRVFIQNFVGSPQELGNKLEYACLNQFDKRTPSISFKVYNRTNGNAFSTSKSSFIVWKLNKGLVNPADYIVIKTETSRVNVRPSFFEDIANNEKIRYLCIVRNDYSQKVIKYDGTYPTETLTSDKFINQSFITKQIFNPFVNWTTKSVQQHYIDGQYFTPWITAFPLPAGE